MRPACVFKTPEGPNDCNTLCIFLPLVFITDSETVFALFVVRVVPMPLFEEMLGAPCIDQRGPHIALGAAADQPSS